MKLKFKQLLLAGLLATGLQVSAQEVINISTGIDANNNLIGFHQPDDDWKVAFPWAPTTFVNVACGSGYVPTYTCGVQASYPWVDPSVRWLSSYMNCPPGYPADLVAAHTADGDTGYFYYRIEFPVQSCMIDSAVLHFPHIGADDKIDQVIVNTTNIHSVLYGWPNVPAGPSVFIPATELNPSGINSITMRVHNVGYQTGMIIKGDITIYGNMSNPAFTLGNNGGTLLGTTNTGSGSHSWVVYGSNSGGTGSYGYVGTYNTYPLSIPSHYKCYFVKHSFTDTCGTSCAAQSICSEACDEKDIIGCDLQAPTNLNYSAPMMTWDPVAGADSYIIEVTTNDTSCCHSDLPKPIVTLTISASGPSHELNLYTELGIDTEEGCFSWRVIPLCKNGVAGPASQKYCTDGTNIGYRKSNMNNTLSTTVKDMSVVIFPNPTKGQVSFDVNTPVESMVLITVSDITGRTVKTFSNVKTSGKKASVQWNTQQMDKGTYLIKVEAGSQQSVKKLIID